MNRRPPRSALSSSSAASDVYKRQASSSSSDDDCDNIGTPSHHPHTQIEPEYHSPLGTVEATMEMFSPTGGRTPGRRGEGGDLMAGDDDDLSPHERHKRRMEAKAASSDGGEAVSYTHLRAHETPEHLVCRLLLEKKKPQCYIPPSLFSIST
eukprot:TRINITY_DN63315_c0_g1_i1.p2 TRINITY_DN63315_c0_g1~~TRINITY_DN63315_c0_g1_i1.p2  ORF type:complete len:152 (+),score=43.07 TRINITY_DN63315_c0_g1_i1:84-539(+)